MSDEIYKGVTISHRGNKRVTVQVEGDEAVNFNHKRQAYAYVDELEDEPEPELESAALDAEVANPRKPVAPKPLLKKLAKSKTTAKAKAKTKK